MLVRTNTMCSLINLQTRRLQLLHCTLDHLAMLVAGTSEFERAFGLRVAEGYLEFAGALEFSLRQMQTALEGAAWWSPWLFVHLDQCAVIGLGGFKGPPDTQGILEVGYSIAPGYRGQGFATEATSALVTHAFWIGNVTL